MVQNGMFLPEPVNDTAIAAPGARQGQPGYAFHDRQRIQPLLSQTWGWIRRNDLITPAADMDGRNGWMMFTPKGEQVSDAQDIQRLRAAADFPRWMIHPSMAEKVWRALMRNDLGDAVLFAFRAVEEAVRSAGGFTANDYGVKLMRDAFNKDKGPLTDLSQPEAEREGLRRLLRALSSPTKTRTHTAPWVSPIFGRLRSRLCLRRICFVSLTLDESHRVMPAHIEPSVNMVTGACL